MNEVLQSLTTRRSCRRFKPDMPPRELIEEVCRAATYAPTGHGKQSPIILAITNQEVRDRLSRQNATIWGHEGDPFYGAPVVLVVLADRSVSTAQYDGCAVLTTLLNSAHALGLDSCWIHRAKEEFDSEEGKQLLQSLGVEGDYVGVGHCVLGYAEGELRPARERKSNYVYWVE